MDLLLVSDENKSHYVDTKGFDRFMFHKAKNKNKPIVVFTGENAAFKFIESILKEYEYGKKVMIKHFNKNLIMTEKEEEPFQSSSTWWI